MKYFESINFITNQLSALNIPYSVRRIYEGYQIIFSWDIGDIACHEGTYHSDIGLVETFKFPWDNGDISILSPIEATIKIIAHYSAYLDKEKEKA